MLFIFSFEFKLFFNVKVPFIKLLFIYVLVDKIFPLLGSIIKTTLFHLLYSKIFFIPNFLFFVSFVEIII